MGEARRVEDNPNSSLGNRPCRESSRSSLAVWRTPLSIGFDLRPRSIRRAEVTVQIDLSYTPPKPDPAHRLLPVFASLHLRGAVWLRFPAGRALLDSPGEIRLRTTRT